LLFRFATLENPANGSIEAYESNREAVPQRQTSFRRVGHPARSDNQLRTLKDLPEGQGNFYLAYYAGKTRQMPPVGRFADAAKQRLIQKRKGLDACATGVELLPE
jgi:hypothetical protein